jgi:hypothetical protein
MRFKTLFYRAMCVTSKAILYYGGESVYFEFKKIQVVQIRLDIK